MPAAMKKPELPHESDIDFEMGNAIGLHDVRRLKALIRRGGQYQTVVSRRHSTAGITTCFRFCLPLVETRMLS